MGFYKRHKHYIKLKMINTHEQYITASNKIFDRRLKTAKEMFAKYGATNLHFSNERLLYLTMKRYDKLREQRLNKTSIIFKLTKHLSSGTSI